MPILLALSFSFLLGISVGIRGSLSVSVVAIVALPVLTIAALQEPYIVLVILIISAFSIDYLQFILGLPRWFGWIPDLLSVLLLGIVLVSRKKANYSVRFPASVAVASLILFLITLLSLWKNGTQFYVALAGIKNYFVYPILFFGVVYLDLSEEQNKRVRLAILYLTLFQVLVAILQYYSFLPGAADPRSGTEDIVSGTLGANATGILSIMSVMVVAVMLNLSIFDRLRLRYLISILVAILGPIFAEGKISIFILPVVLLIIIILTFVRRPANGGIKKIFIALSTISLLSFLVINLIPSLTKSSSVLEILSSQEALIQYLTRTSSDFQFAKFGRFTDISETTRLIMSTPSTFMFGFGPGELSGTAMNVSASLWKYFWYIDKGIGGVQGTALFFELGLLGISAYLALLLSLISGTMKVIRTTENQIPLLESTSFINIFVLYVLSLLYTQSWWSSALSISFWTLAAMHWVIISKEIFCSSTQVHARTMLGGRNKPGMLN